MNGCAPRVYLGNAPRDEAGRVELSKRQHELLCWTIDRRAETGVLPSVREMADFLGCVSTNAVNDLLAAMEGKGWILRPTRSGRRGLSRSTAVLADPRGPMCIGCGEHGKALQLARGAICLKCCLETIAGFDILTRTPEETR